MTFGSIRVPFVRRLYLLGFIAVLPSLPALAQTTNTPAPTVQSAAVWETYMVSGEEFSVQLPVLPAMSTYDRFGSFGQSLLPLRHLIGAYSQGVAYAVYIFERKQSLDEFTDAFGHSSAVDFKRDLNVAGVVGKEYAFKRDDTSRTTQFYMTKKHIYVFEAAGSDLGNVSTGLQRFFGSIKFAMSPEGKVIIDGLGEQPKVEAAVASSDNAQVFKSRDVTRRVLVVAKPEPNYTERARQNQVIGVVVLRAVLSSTG